LPVLQLIFRLFSYFPFSLEMGGMWF